MIICSEINRFIKQGKTVTATVPGVEHELRVLKARVGHGLQLQVRVSIDSVEQWRTTTYSAVRVASEE